jgi:retinol-binding protein 3
MHFNQHVLLILLSLLLFKPSAAEAQDTEKMNPKAVRLLIDSIGSALNRSYVYPDKAALMTGYLKKKYKSGGYNNVKDRFELGRQLLQDLQEICKDRHLHLVYDPSFATVLETPMSETEMRRNFERGLENDRANNFHFMKTEILPGNIGYLRWNGFSGFVEEATPTFDAAFRFVANCQALIIDMRYNGGGAPSMVLHTQSYFFDEQTRMNDVIDRNNDTVKRWTDPAASDFKLTMPVYILTSRFTFSGAEDFTYGLQQVHRATIVGDTTGGGAHPTREFSIGQGFVLSVPTHRSPNIVSGTDWEGTGVRPEVAVSSKQALARTQALVYAELLAKTTDEQERQQLQWYLTSLENKTLLTKQLQGDCPDLATETLLGYCGTYRPTDPASGLPEIEIILDGKFLYRQYDQSEPLRLVQVSATRFVYDDDSGRTIEFVNLEGVAVILLSNQFGTFTLKKN